MTAANKEQIKQYILKLIDGADKDYVSKTVDNFQISKSTVYNYVQQMCKDNIIEKADERVPSYVLVSQKYTFRYKNDGSLEEDRIFNRDIEHFFKVYENNVFSVWRYAFLEMMNNAIEHSRAADILVKVWINPLRSQIIIEDNGIGIFKNIQAYMKKEKNCEMTLDECVPLLFAGKFTTAKELHSGEGIFFTSHLMDKFAIISDNILFTRDNFKDVQVSDIPSGSGTVVLMSLYNQSKKTTREVFNRFSDVEEGFIRTHIPISHMFPNGNPISRSEARRLGELIAGFKEIALDFANVDEVGQAFCHDVTLNICNADEAVDYMIRRVKNTRQ